MEHCWSGQGDCLGDLESLNNQGPSFELLCCWGEAEKETGSGGKDHPCPLRLNVGPRELSFRNVCLIDLCRTPEA